MNIRKRMLGFTTNRTRAFKQQVFRPSIDNTLCFALTVTVTIYKVLWPKRLKIGMIKEQQHNRLKNETKLDGKNFRVENFL